MVTQLKMQLVCVRRNNLLKCLYFGKYIQGSLMMILKQTVQWMALIINNSIQPQIVMLTRRRLFVPKINLIRSWPKIPFLLNTTKNCNQRKLSSRDSVMIQSQLIIAQMRMIRKQSANLLLKYIKKIRSNIKINSIKDITRNIPSESKNR